MRRMQTIEKVIGENTFYIRPFGAFAAANISGELAALLSPILAGIAPLFGGLDTGDGGSENEISYNLQELLTSNNSFSEFLNAHQITFRKGAGNRIILCYRDRQISLENTMSTDVCYLRSRLGYNSGREDFCFNGFAFRDLLMKNQYTRQLQDCPEILERLESYLRIKGLAKEYAEKSEYYCFMYRFPIGCVIFDGKDDLTVEEKQLHLLNQVAYRLYQYSGDSRYLYDHDNPILRLKDDDNASVDCLVSTEIITSDMIE